jgi:hypothetical protein
LRRVTDTDGLLIPSPQFSGGGIGSDFLLQTGRIVDFDDLVSVRRIRKLQTEHLSVGLRLLYPVGCRPVVGLGLDHRQREVPCVAEQEIDSLGRFSNKAFSYRNDPSICNCALFGYGVRAGVPADG